MAITRHKMLACPVCRAPLDAAADTGLNGLPPRPPEPGDRTVCAFCACVLLYEPGPSLRVYRADEIARLSKAERWELRVIQTGLAALIGRGKRPS